MGSASAEPYPPGHPASTCPSPSVLTWGAPGALQGPARGAEQRALEPRLGPGAAGAARRSGRFRGSSRAGCRAGGRGAGAGSRGPSLAVSSGPPSCFVSVRSPPPAALTALLLDPSASSQSPHWLAFPSPLPVPTSVVSTLVGPPISSPRAHLRDLHVGGSPFSSPRAHLCDLLVGQVPPSPLPVPTSVISSFAGSPFSSPCAHLRDLHVGWVPTHRAILLSVACVAHQLAVPDPEVSAARGALREHCDGRADRGRELVRARVHGSRWGRVGYRADREGGTHRRLPRLVAYLMWLQM